MSIRDELFNKINFVGRDTINLFYPEPISPLDHSDWEMVISFCDEHNIKGIRFAKFIYFCCDGKKEKILLTIDAINRGMVCNALLNDNLDLTMPVPFIDEKKLIYVYNSRKEFILNPEQKEAFLSRLSNRISEEQAKNQTTKTSFLKRIRKNK